MLREIRGVGQRPGEAPRRWFQSKNLDLFVWAPAPGHYSRLQLAYDKATTEKALTWDETLGYTHDRVDHAHSAGRHPASPLLVAAEAPDIERLAALFAAESANLDAGIRDWVALTIARYTSSAVATPTAATPVATRNAPSALLVLPAAFILLTAALAALTHLAP